MFFFFGAALLVILVMMLLLFGLVLVQIVPIALAILGGVVVSAMFGGPSLGTTALAALVLYLVFNRRQRRRRLRRRRSYDVDAVATTIKEPMPSGEPLLDDSFAALADHADWARARIGVAEERCRLFLRLADRQPFDSEAGDLAVRIRKRVPEHVGVCLEACEAATRAERRAILEGTVATIEEVGAEADRQRLRLLAPAVEALDVQRRHLTRKRERGPFETD